MEKEIEKIIESDMTAKEFFEGLLDLSFMSEEERETIYIATECFAKGKARVEQANSHAQKVDLLSKLAGKMRKLEDGTMVVNYEDVQSIISNT